MTFSSINLVPFKNSSVIALGLLLTIFFGTSASFATTYYVTQNGNNKHSGTSWDSSWKTLQHAGKKASAGDTVVIRKGQSPYKYLPIRNSGKPNKPIVFKGESSTDKPIITGAKRVKNWKKSAYQTVWTTLSKNKPHRVLENDEALKKASTVECLDGQWFWDKQKLYYKPSDKKPSAHNVWMSFAAGGAVIRSQSWIELHNLHFWFGAGAGVSIRNGHHVKLNNITAQWHWIGIDLSANSSHNTIENCTVSNNGSGIYLRRGSHHNSVRNCLSSKNGNLPWWTKGDRAGIAIGEKGPNIGNIIENNEVSYNGAPYSDPGVTAYDAPNTLIRNNNIHHNYGFGLFVTIASHNTTVSNNKINFNGIPAVQAKLKGMSGLSIRHSHDVLIENNEIIGNHVSSDSRWPNIMMGPKGGVDVLGHPGQDMTNIKFINNIVSGTVGGPNFRIDRKANLSGLVIIPKKQAPDWYQ